MGPLSPACDGEPPQRGALLCRWRGAHLFPLFTGRADDQAPPRRDDISQEALDQLALALARDILQTGADEIEASRRRPVDRIPDEDALRPPWQAAARQVGQFGGNVQTVWLDDLPTVPAPAYKALHQVATGAADVQEGPIPIDRFGDQAARDRPGSIVATIAGLGARVIAGQIGRDDHSGNFSIPLRLVDLPRHERHLQALQPGVVLGTLQKQPRHAFRPIAAPRPNRATRRGAVEPGTMSSPDCATSYASVSDGGIRKGAADAVPAGDPRTARAPLSRVAARSRP